MSVSAVELGIWLPWVALGWSILALVVVVAVRLAQVKKAGQELVGAQRGAAALFQECDGLESSVLAARTALAAMREILSRLEKKPSVGVRAEGEDDLPPVNPRFTRFIDLQMAWEKQTGQRLQGPAITDGQVIEELTIPRARPPVAEHAELLFTVAARRVVEYMVSASGTSRVPVDEEQVGKVLDEMAKLVGLKLIEPRPGQRYDPTLHKLFSRVAADGNQPGTIAKVEVRGLVRGNGSVLKAQVHLYD